MCFTLRLKCPLADLLEKVRAQKGSPPALLEGLLEAGLYFKGKRRSKVLLCAREG